MKKILILTSRAGGGHMSAAKAIEEAVKTYYPGEYEITIKDIFGVFGVKLENFADSIYPKMAKRAKFTYKAFFDFTDRKTFPNDNDKTFYPLIKNKIAKSLEDKPDVIISCFPYFTYSFSRFLRESNLQIPLVALITDTGEVHSTWMSDYFDYHLAPTVETGFWLTEKGVPVDKVKVFGFPLKQVFYKKYSKNRVRKLLGINKDNKVLLYLNSGWNLVGVNERVKALDKELEKVSIVVITGNNKLIKRKLVHGHYKNQVIVLGFVDNIPELLNAADLVVSKAGGASTMEVIKMKKPVIISEVVPGQEEPNAKFIERMGFGFLEEKVDGLAKRAKYIFATNDIERILSNYQNYSLMERADKRVAEFIDKVSSQQSSSKELEEQVLA